MSSALDSTTAFRQSDLSLQQGQLTSFGFMQHIQLGSLLHTSYRNYLQSFDEPSEIYVRSTNYIRTIRVSPDFSHFQKSYL
jgi:hypothetical protein